MVSDTKPRIGTPTAMGIVGYSGTGYTVRNVISSQSSTACPPSADVLRWRRGAATASGPRTRALVARAAEPTVTERRVSIMVDLQVS